MKKIFNKFTKILLLVAMVISDLMTPIKVFAAEGDNSGNTNKEPVSSVTMVYNNGTDVTNARVDEDGNILVDNDGNKILEEGDIVVTKSVEPINPEEGQYRVNFDIYGKSVKTTVPIYSIVILDRSQSMLNVDNKWDNAKEAAMAYVDILKSNPRNQYALITFCGNSPSNPEVKIEPYAGTTSFSSTPYTRDYLDNSIETPVHGTYLSAAMKVAYEELLPQVPSGYQAVVVVVSDGNADDYRGMDDSATNDNLFIIPRIVDGHSFVDNDVNEDYPLNNFKSQLLTNLQNKAKIFTVGYDLDNRHSLTVSQSARAKAILKNTASTPADFIQANVGGLDDVLADIANSVSAAAEGAALIEVPNGTYNDDGTLATNPKFSLMEVEDNSARKELAPINENVQRISYDIQIDKTLPSGVYETNDTTNTKIVVQDENGNDQTLVVINKSPSIEWTRPIVNYTVNYYKDSIKAGNEVGEPFVGSAELSTTINESDVNKNLRLSEAGEGYEFNSIENTPLTITDNEDENIINVLYTLKKFNYTVNYYYDGVKDNNKSYEVKDVTYGTVVNANELYFANTDEYNLDTERSTSGNVTINNNGITIDIYYVKNSYNYSVHYNFNGVEDKDFAKNNLAALYGTELFAGNYYLSSEELSNKYSDYFLDPVDPGKSKNNETITVGNKENKLDICYINTYFDNNSEETSKSTTTEKVTSSNQPVDYTITYKNTIKNVREGDTITVTVTDNLPFEIDTNNENTKINVTDEDGNVIKGVYNSTNKTITWTFTKTIGEFTKTYTIDKTISFSVVYKDFAEISAEKDNNLVNTATGKTTVNNKESNGDTSDGVEVPVEISGNLIVHHYEKDKDGNDVSVYRDERTSGLVGSDYTTNYRTDIIGYTVDTNNMPSNKNGKYAVNDTEVIYYYVKKDGVIDNPTTEKVAENKEVESVNSTFNYTITGSATIKDYIGTYKVRATDYLPYKLDTTGMEKLDENVYKVNDRCVYDGNMTVVCESVAKDITKDMYDSNKEYSVSETFELSIKYLNITNATVTNRAKIDVILDNNSKPSEPTSEDVTVKEGSVKAVYLENGKENNILAKEYTNTGLVGTNYETPFKPVFGYTLDKDPENKNGTYIDGEILVKYLYNKNKGTFVDDPEADKTGPDSVDSINSEFNYTITGTASIKDYVGTYKVKVVDTLPYSIDKDKSTLDNRCTYDGKNTITCVSEEKTVTESYYVTTEDGEKVFNIKEKFTLVLVYNGITTESVKNSAKVEIILDDNSKESPVDTVETKVKEGTVKATYNTTDGEELADAVTTSGIGGSEYTTEAKEFFGYHLTETPKNNEGTYIADTEILVEYIYELNDGEITNNKVTKKGPKVISDVNDYTEYVFTYDGTVKDYIGKATLTLTDVLPYEIYVANYDGDRCDYDFENNTFTCKVEYDITEEDYVNGEYNIHEEFYLDVIYGEIDSDVITNKVDSKLELRKVYKDSESSVDSKILKGDLVVSYVDEEGNVLDSYTITDHAGLYYETEEKEFDGYTFKSNSDNVEGFLIANETIYVEYVYSKNVGTYEELPPQTGVEDTSVNFIKYLVVAFLFILLGKKKEVKNN